MGEIPQARNHENEICLIKPLFLNFSTAEAGDEEDITIFSKRRWIQTKFIPILVILVQEVRC